jgi:hypothetical protein
MSWKFRDRHILLLYRFALPDTQDVALSLSVHLRSQLSSASILRRVSGQLTTAAPYTDCHWRQQEHSCILQASAHVPRPEHTYRDSGVMSLHIRYTSEPNFQNHGSGALLLRPSVLKALCALLRYVLVSSHGVSIVQAWRSRNVQWNCAVRFALCCKSAASLCNAFCAKQNRRWKQID